MPHHADQKHCCSEEGEKDNDDDQGLLHGALTLFFVVTVSCALRYCQYGEGASVAIIYTGSFWWCFEGVGYVDGR